MNASNNLLPGESMCAETALIREDHTRSGICVRTTYLYGQFAQIPRFSHTFRLIFALISCPYVYWALTASYVCHFPVVSAVSGHMDSSGITKRGVGVIGTRH